MPDLNKTLIMKFGGASVKTPESFSYIADLIVTSRKEFSRVAVVVSAMGDMTDQLIALAKKVHSDPPRREYDMLVSTGERVSIALLAMALACKGVEAVSFTGSQSGIITCESHKEAKIVDVKPHRLLAAFETGKIVIVAGFQGVSLSKEITTLGRGGSDTTAVALGAALRAEKVEFYKDVPGICEQDPKKVPNAPFFKTLSYEKALKVVQATGNKVLHPRAILLAKKNFLPLHVRSFADISERGTWIEEEMHQSIKTIFYEE